jgi:hypothetical protein
MGERREEMLSPISSPPSPLYFPSMTTGARALALCCLIWTAACDNGATSPPGAIIPKCTGAAFFNVPPIPLTNVTGWVPLGNLNPVSHVFPTDHQYLYYALGGAASLDVVAPGIVYVTRAKRSQYSTGLADYSLEFQPCDEVKGEFGHLSALDPALEDLIGAFDQNCQTYSPNPGLSVTQCYSKNVAIKAVEGTTLATVGTVATSIALDWSFFDARATKIVFANDGRWQTSSDGFDHFHVVPASDYFTEPMKTQVAAKLGNYNGTILRTVAPLGGTIAADSTGIQGHWFISFAPTYPESQHLAIARDNANPNDYAISVGTSQPGFTGGSFPFTPSASGTNKIPAAVTSADGIVCYQATNNAVVLVEAQPGATQVIKVEVRPSTPTCASQAPYTFTAGKTTSYLR